jgi:Transcriptional regulator, AbiEi antitoxin, Type IV TA system
VKNAIPVKKLKDTLLSEAVTALESVFINVPAVRIKNVNLQPRIENRWGSRSNLLFDDAHQLRPDLVAEVSVAGQTWTLIAEVRTFAAPKPMREQVKLYLSALQQSELKRSYPVLIASWFSPEVVATCAEEGIGTIDFQGNCHLAFGTVFIERTGHPAPLLQLRQARALFAPKSTRLLRVLLKDPHRAWKIQELVTATQLSLGQVSNVRGGLIEREFAERVVGGIRLTKPQKLLEAWRLEYKGPRAQRQGFYTLLHGEALDTAITRALKAAQKGSHAILAASSAARWLAPYLRTSGQFFYADGPGLKALTKELQLEPVSKGENIVIYLEPDEGIFMDRLEAAPGIWTTGLAQTYLDLALSGERGLEAAQHLLETKLESVWKGLS